MPNRNKLATDSNISEDDAGVDTLLKTSAFLNDKASRAATDVSKGVADPKTSSQTVEKLATKKKPNPSLPSIREVSKAADSPSPSRLTKAMASRDSPSKDVPSKRKKTNVEKEGDKFQLEANVGSSFKRSKKQLEPKSNPEPKSKPEPKANPGPKAKPEPKANPGPKAKPDPHAKPSQAKPEPKAKPDSKAKPSQAPRTYVEKQEKELESNMHPPRVHYKHKQAAKPQVEAHPSGKSKSESKQKSRKRKISDSFVAEEEKVQTVKKMKDVSKQKDKRKNILEGGSLEPVKKEDEPGNDSESSFQKGKRRLKQKGPSEAKIKKEFLDSEYPTMRSRVVPLSLFKAIRDAKVNMKLFLDSIGFGSLHGINMERIPGRLGRLVVKLFDSKEFCMNIDEASIHVNADKVHDMFGLPIGGRSLLSLDEKPKWSKDPATQDWFKQFDMKMEKIRACHIADKITTATRVDFIFKLNFLMLITNTLGKNETTNGDLSFDVLKRIRDDTPINSIDWCGYICNCLYNSKVPEGPGLYYNGPLFFLVLLYLDSTKFEPMPYIRSRPAIKDWNSTLLKNRMDLEIEHGVFGNLELHGEWTAEEAGVTEGFFEADEAHDFTRLSYPPAPTTQEGFCKKLEAKFSIISDEMEDLQETLKQFKKKFPGDAKLPDYFEKYAQLLKNVQNLNDKVDQEDDDDSGGENGIDDGSEDDAIDDEEADEEEDSGDEEDSEEDDVDAEEKEGSEDDDGDSEEKEDSEDDDGGEDSEEDDGEEDSEENDGEEEENKDEEVSKDDGKEEEKEDSEENDGEEDSEKDDGEENSEEDDGDEEENKDEEVSKDDKEHDAVDGKNVSNEDGKAVDETDDYFQLLDMNIDRIVNKDHDRPVVNASLKTPAKRQARPSVYLCSPYMNKKTVIDTLMTSAEYKVSNYLFSMLGENREVVFETKSGDSLIRDQIESLAPRFCVDSSVIGCWSALLNYEEKFKEPGALSRHFFDTGCVTRNMCHGGLTWEQQCEIFDAQIAFSFKNKTDGSNLKDVDLVFFPILGSECFYVVVFNLKKMAINILNNNRDETASYETDYKDKCDLLIKLFARYLECVGHRKSQAVATAVPHIPKLKCTTTEKNIEDSGIFCMHHMEMYMGEPFSKWDCGIVGQSDKQHLLLLLRVKYATKILLHEINVHARKNMRESEEFDVKFAPVTRREMIKNAILARANRERR